MRPLTTMLVATAIAAFAFACGGGGESELEKSSASITEEQLEVMVLPQEAFGDEAEDLEVDSDSGAETADDAADDSFDPDDTGADLEEAGYRSGYTLGFIDPTFASLDDGGVFTASSTVDLFTNAELAVAANEKDIEDGHEFEGEEIESDVVLEEFEEFEVDGVADDAVGIKYRATIAEAEFWGTGVVFSVGPIRAGAGYSRGDDEDMTEAAEQAAQALADRIESVLLGETDETPVPIPTPDDDDEEAGERPEEPPFPENMVLDIRDLPPGASVDFEGYVLQEDGYAYEREFDLSSVEFPVSSVISAQCSAVLHDAEFGAKAYFLGQHLLFTSPEGGEFFADAFGEEVEFETSNVRVEEIVIDQRGDESFAGRVVLESPLGTLELIFLGVRIGRATGTIVLSGLGEGLSIDDMVALLDKTVENMEAELAES